jgi:hypothetical protein
MTPTVFVFLIVAVICWVMKQLVDIGQAMQDISKKLEMILPSEQVSSNSDTKDS